ncbi:MAG: CPBP family intramembrane glutamic endopeptidase [Planctomycetota bacterium]
METAFIPTLGQAASAEAGGLAYWLSVAFWAGVGAVLLGALGFVGALRGSVLRRGPLRELELSAADLVVGFGSVGLVYAGKWPGAPAGLQQASSLGLLLGAGFFVVKAALSEAGVRRAGLVPRRPVRDLWVSAVGLVFGVGLTFATLVLVNAAATAAGYPSPEVNHELLQELRESPSAQRVLGIALAAVVVAPLLEELVFRGMLQTWLLQLWGRRRRWLTVVTAAALFAGVHVGLVSWHGLPGLFVLGLVLGWLYEKTGSLLPAVLVHAGFNAVNIGYVLLVPGP